MAKMNMKIKVTKDHIIRGQPGECDNCPVALAIREQYPNVKEIMVAEAQQPIVYIITVAGRKLSFELLPEALSFICDFDGQYCGIPSYNKNSFKPFEFELTESTD